MAGALWPPAFERVVSVVPEDRAQAPNRCPPKAPPSRRSCTACLRVSLRLCVVADAQTGTLYEVCETCALCEEVRRVAARLPEGTSSSEFIRRELRRVYQFARADLDSRDAESWSSDPERESEGEGEAIRPPSHREGPSCRERRCPEGEGESSRSRSRQRSRSA